MKKLLSILLIVGFLAGGVFLGYAAQPSQYKVNAGDARWNTKLNAGLDALWDYYGAITATVSNWTGIQSYQTATYIGASSFSVVGDLTSKYSAGQLLFLNQGVSGVAANIVVSSSFGGGITTVIVTTANLTANLAQAQILNPTGSDVVVAADYGSNQAALAAADVVAAAAGKQLLIGRTYSITTDCPLASNIKVLPGALITIANTKTLTINGSLDAGLYQIFSCTGTGKVVFGSPTAVYPEWWGVDGTADEVQIIAAATSLPAAGGTVTLAGSYNYGNDIAILNSNIVFTGGGTLQATAKNIRGLQFGTTGVPVTNCKAIGLTIIGYSKDDGGTSSGRGALHIANGSSKCFASNIYIKNASGSGIVDDGTLNTFENIQIYETGEHGIYCSSPVGSVYNNFIIVDVGKDSALTTPFVYGVKIDGSVQCNYNNFYIKDSLTHAVQFAGTSTGNVFSNFQIYHMAATGQNAISMSGGTATENIVSNGYIYNTAAYSGFVATAGVRFTLDNVTIIQCANAGGITISSTSSYGIITNCKVISKYVPTPAAAISAAAAIAVVYNSNTVKDCQVLSGTGTWAVGISVGGGLSNNKIIGNTIEATTKYLIANKNRDLILEDESGIATLQTTNATPSNVFTFAVQPSKTYYVEIEVIGREAAGANNAIYKKMALVTTAADDTPTLVGQTAISGIESDAAWDCNVAVSAAGYIYAQVTGKAVTTIDWKCRSFKWTSQNN